LLNKRHLHRLACHLLHLPGPGHAGPQLPGAATAALRCQRRGGLFPSGPVTTVPAARRLVLGWPLQDLVLRWISTGFVKTFRSAGTNEAVLGRRPLRPAAAQ
jgi:hypothetical protein